jgi:formamidopyrimidine-DNA glycosylase
MLQWGIVSGSLIQAQYGVRGGEMGKPDMLTVRRASKDYMCRDCRSVIAKGTLHGVSVGEFSHYCTECVTDTEPETVFKTKAA